MVARFSQSNVIGSLPAAIMNYIFEIADIRQVVERIWRNFNLPRLLPPREPDAYYPPGWLSPWN